MTDDATPGALRSNAGLDAMSMKCTACRKPYQPSRALAPFAAGGMYPPAYTPGACECGGTQFEGVFSSGDSVDNQRLLNAMALATRERIGVLPADGDRTDWCGYMTRKREKRKGSQSWHAYGPTPAEAIEATWAEFMASNAKFSGPPALSNRSADLP